MCIALLSTQHPQYPLIILNNRDEFLHRPTARASWWDTPATTHIFSGRDLARPERGTWLGVTKQGRITILTNFREDSSAAAIGTRSRGAMVNAFLTAPETSVRSINDWVHTLLTSDGEGGCKGVGGFSLICGTICPKHGTNSSDGRVVLQPLAVVSNRTTPTNNEAHWICDTPEQVYALSNDPYADSNPWPKVTLGKDLLGQTVEAAVRDEYSEEDLVEALFGVLSHDTLPILPGRHTYETDLESLKHSIFIPAFEVQTEHDSDPANTRTNHPLTSIPETNNVTQPAAHSTTPHSKQNGHSTPPKPVLVTKPTGKDELHSICATPITASFHPTPHLPAGVPIESPRVYGTQKQTVILVDRSGKLKYVERTLYDGNASWVGGEEGRDVVCEFEIEGWET